MKIAFVAGNDLTQSARLRRHARTLAAAGHRVTVFGVRSKTAEDEEDEAGVVYVRARLSGWRAGTSLRNPVRVARWFERFEPVVTAAVRRETPELIHACGLDVAGPAQDAAIALGVPFVYEVEGAPYTERLAEMTVARPKTARDGARSAAVAILRRKAGLLETKLRVRGIRATITDTASLADDLVHRYGGERPTVVRSCPPFRASRRSDVLRRRVGAARRERLLVLAGPITDGCGVETAIRALPLLGDRYVLVLVGAIPRLARFERLAEEVGVADRVRFVPPTPDLETLNLLASADVALVPTEPSTASGRLSVPERLYLSLTAGLPVVASDTPEVGAIIRKTGAGTLYPARSPQDPAALAEGVHTLFADPTLAKTCAEAARHAVGTHLNWETESRRLIDLYDEIGSGR